jgi:hypothetical protein
MWLESAGGGLRVGSAGKWVAALTAAERADLDAERRAFAELRWDEQHGDRHTAMTVLMCGARAAEIRAGLDGALLTDDELRSPQDWIHYDDPFGDWHEDPCAEIAEGADDAPAHQTQNGDRK